MNLKNDSALAHVHEIMPVADFAKRYPTVYASHDLMVCLAEHQVAHVDVRPTPWPVEEPQTIVSTASIVKPGLVVALLDEGTALVGSPKAVYRHLKDDLKVRFWLGTEKGLAQQAVANSVQLATLANRLQAMSA